MLWKTSYERLSIFFRMATNLNDPVNYIVVWEKKCNTTWIPYSPTITRNLERAFLKKLTRINLKDCESNEDDCHTGITYINIKIMQQVSDDSELPSLKVRRSFYKSDSPAGKGFKWEWSENGLWRRYNMEVQQIIESAYLQGLTHVDIKKSFSKASFCVHFDSFTQTVETSKFQVPIRRKPEAPYPKLPIKNKLSLKMFESGSSKMNKSVQVDKSEFPKFSHLSSNKIDVKGAKKQEQLNTTTITRHILNLVGNNSHGKFSFYREKNSTESKLNSDIKNAPQKTKKNETSTTLIRRPSVDTVSTYLSHESQTIKRSGSSIFVLLDYPRVQEMNYLTNSTLSTIIGVDEASNSLARFVQIVDKNHPAQGPCPYCYKDLSKCIEYPTVFLERCFHQIHLNCLNELILKMKSQNQSNLFIQCLICSAIYGKKIGNQPHGTMTWFKNSEGFIEITYSFSSGNQSEEHPHPRKKYFALGFPRKQLLPDNYTGRNILKYLKTAFDRKLLFTIGCSTTTGVEDIILSNNVDLRSYTDPDYLERVMNQLKFLGITD